MIEGSRSKWWLPHDWSNENAFRSHGYSTLVPIPFLIGCPFWCLMWVPVWHLLEETGRFCIPIPLPNCEDLVGRCCTHVCVPASFFADHLDQLETILFLSPSPSRRVQLNDAICLYWFSGEKTMRLTTLLATCISIFKMPRDAHPHDKNFQE